MYCNHVLDPYFYTTTLAWKPVKLFMYFHDNYIIMQLIPYTYAYTPNTEAINSS